MAVKTLTITEEAEQCVTVQKQLKQEGKMMAKSDLFIAGISKQNNLSLVTCDTDFLHVKDISVLLVR